MRLTLTGHGKQVTSPTKSASSARAATVFRFTVSKLKPHHTYRIKVRAVSAGGTASKAKGVKTKHLKTKHLKTKRR